MQEDIRRGQKSKKNDEALDRLEEGMREAIVSNFNLLREAAISELKNYWFDLVSVFDMKWLLEE